MSALFTPLTLRGTTFRNRLWVAPLCQYSVEERDGVPTDWHLVHLGSFALGGAGLVMTEATAVNPVGRISPEDTGIWNDEQRDAWARITAFIRLQGAVAGIQLAHAGRKGSTWREFDPRHGTQPASEGGWSAVGPSAIAFPGYDVPHELTVDEIASIVDDFAAAAGRAIDAGFQLLEVHAAHGYLLHEFLSPLSNERTDEYGGSLENRARLLLAIVRAVRERVGTDIPVLVRFSATDWAENGWTREETAAVAAWAQRRGRRPHGCVHRRPRERSVHPRPPRLPGLIRRVRAREGRSSRERRGPHHVSPAGRGDRGIREGRRGDDGP